MSSTAQTQSFAKGSLLGASLLIAGTCIGGGMLALPVLTAGAGFTLSVAGLFTCWAIMVYTGLLLVEVACWIRGGGHFSSLSERLIGKRTRMLSFGVYLFMNYASLIAYTAGGAALLRSWVGALGFSLSYGNSCILFTLLFGLVVLWGAQILGRFNSVLMFLLGGCYLGLVLFAAPHVNPEYLTVFPAWQEGWGIFSILLAAFSYQMVVPSVCVYLQYNIDPLKKAVWIGTSIPCIIYLLWIFVVHGTVPLEGEHGLREAFVQGASATTPLRFYLHSPYLSGLADGFAFLAISTSYLGLSLALFHFLQDFFRGRDRALGRNGILFLTLVPTVLLAVFFPRALLQCLEVSGGWGDTLLSGLLPIAMVWAARYRKGSPVERLVPGGRMGLILAALFFAGVFLLQFRILGTTICF